MQKVEDETGDTPFALKNKPELHDWSLWVWDAFWLCGAGRPIYDGSIGMIPLTEIVAYVVLDRVSGTEQRQYLVRMIRALDTFYRSKINARIARKVEQDRVDAERIAERERDNQR